MKSIKKYIYSIVAVVGLTGLIALPSLPVGAVDVFDACKDDTTNTSVICEHKTEDAGSVVGVVVNTLLFITGALSVIMIIVGGMRYTISRGDSSNVTAAKNTIMYAVVGLIVASVAFVVVNWVLNLF